MTIFCSSFSQLHSQALSERSSQRKGEGRRARSLSEGALSHTTQLEVCNSSLFCCSLYFALTIIHRSVYAKQKVWVRQRQVDLWDHCCKCLYSIIHVTSSHWISSVASFPGLPTVQLLITYRPNVYRYIGMQSKIYNYCTS